MAAFILGILIAWTAAAVYLLIRLEAWRPASVRGPKRMGPHESALPLLVITGAGFLLWLLGVAVPLSLIGVPVEKLRPMQKLAALLYQAVVGLAGLVALNAALRPGGLRRIGLGPAHLGRGLSGGLLGIFIILPLMYWVAFASEVAWKLLHKPHPQAHDLLMLLGRQPTVGMVVLTVLVAVVLVPAFEELMFRGHVQTLLARGLRSRWAAIVIASALFAALHPWWTQPPIFFLSLCLGYAYERTGNLWTPIVIHAAFNGSSTALFLLVSRQAA